MTTDERRTRTTVGICVFCALLCTAALWFVVPDLRQIADALASRPMASRTLENTWIGQDGDTYRVSVTSELGESTAHLIQRFETDLADMKAKHPRR